MLSCTSFSNTGRELKVTTKPTNPWDLAKEKNQALVVRIIGPMYGVYYPWRRTGDLYVAMEGHPIRCCQCEQDIPCDAGLEDWLTHIRSHARRKLVNPIVFIAEDNEGKLVVAQEKKA
jgi:hypothetical protein